MYNIEKIIEEGRSILNRHPKRSLDSADLEAIRDRHPHDLIYCSCDAFRIGVAVGMRIAKAEMKRDDHRQSEELLPSTHTAQNKISHRATNTVR